MGECLLSFRNYIWNLAGEIKAAHSRSPRYTEFMIIAALAIGAITAYYFGLRVGAFAAGGAFLLFVGGVVMPSKLLWSYGLVGAFTLGVLVLGPRMPSKKQNKADFLGLVRKGSGKLRGLYHRFRK